ncbi:ATP-binding protein [uncultured Adlercreutzia sp.]|uniref:ATP-binding protein n=1 Tax=uncultured Adlercreutzia sp. TaxID=875803 RepID=UPI00258E19DE|nr:ATP-binding protein [uncultured Adlercreutzia sp.]
MYRRNYRYEKIEGATRNLHERIPEEAFREAVANALVHRLWDSPANVQISMNDRGVKIVSPGGLPSDLSYDEYVEDRISVLRNPIIANVFLRLNYIEAFGTGVARIRAAYEGSAAKPKFSVTENAICVELPVVTEEVALTDDEKRALALFEEGKEVSRRDLESMLGMSQTKAGRVLKSLADKGSIYRRAGGRSTTYLRA